MTEEAKECLVMHENDLKELQELALERVRNEVLTMDPDEAEATAQVSRDLMDQIEDVYSNRDDLDGSQITGALKVLLVEELIRQFGPDHALEVFEVATVPSLRISISLLCEIAKRRQN